jgi:hypothetical protein
LQSCSPDFTLRFTKVLQSIALSVIQDSLRYGLQTAKKPEFRGVKEKSMFRSLVWLCLLVTSISWGAPAQVLIIRHGEKPDTGNDLSSAGQERAQNLISYFEKNPDVTRYGTPVAIYGFGPGADDGSLRGIETVTPLADALGLKVQSQFTKNDLQPIVDEVMSKPTYDGKMVLICWEHKMIPALAHQFGADQAPDAWAGSDVYDQVWEIDFSGETVSNFKTFSEGF